MTFSILSIFLLVLVVSGGIFVTMKEDAPVWERVQVLGVGYAILIGALLRIFIC